MFPAILASCVEPPLVILCDKFSDGCAGNDVKARSLVCRTKPNKDVVMIWREELLALLGEHPNFSINLARLALNSYGMRAGLVGGENINAASVA